LQIIFVDRRMAQARTVTLTRTRMVAAALALTLTVLAVAAGLSALAFRLAAEADVPVVRNIVSFVMRDQVERNEQYVQNNVSAMARMLGDIQARMLRLDALGERVSKLAGIRPEEFNFKDLPGRGGPLPADARALSLRELQDQVARVDQGVEQRADFMNVVESELVSNEARDALLPHGTPVSQGFVGSGFGVRLDPFTGQQSMHAGLDFPAPEGTAIFAAAGGVVVSAEPNTALGNMVEIDHGKGLSTVYGHTSRMLVKVGDIVRKGQKIAEVGTTGRSTGPHLHFEVHVNGVPQNPTKYLASLRKAPTAAVATLAPAAAVPAPAPAPAPTAGSAAASDAAAVRP
jgi:murein DD-endopeptidase MepM/ murein hydrolase activator NlpD